MSTSDNTHSHTARSCSCGNQAGNHSRLVTWTTVGGTLAALGVCAACCLLPFVLLSIGVAGAWVSTLDALARYKWLFIVATTVLLGCGFYAAYWQPKRSCAAGASCEVCGSSRSVRVGLWAATILAISGVVFERLEPLFLGL
jgi:mercuric ion transport protein